MTDLKRLNIDDIERITKAAYYAADEAVYFYVSTHHATSPHAKAHIANTFADTLYNLINKETQND